MDVLVIPDIQARPNSDLTYLYSIAAFIEDQRPDSIVFLGDVWDMASLSKYESPRSPRMEGQRIGDDIIAGKKAVSIVMSGVTEVQARQRRGKRRVWQPDVYFLMGNHENRLTKLYLEDARFEYLVNEIPTFLTKCGIQVIPFLDVLELGGVLYSHYFENASSSSPIGRAHLLLQKRHRSMTAGHRQGLDYAVSEVRANGKLLMGLIAGACYEHDEHYKSGLTNTHWRGIIYKQDCHEGEYSPSFISLDTLKRMYGEDNELVIRTD